VLILENGIFQQPAKPISRSPSLGLRSTQPILTLLRQRTGVHTAAGAVAIVPADSIFFAVAFLIWPSRFDPAKNARNIAQRGLSFERVADLDWETAVVIEDTRRDYGGRRLRVMARLDGRLHAVVVTPRGEDLRVISFRRANRREVRRYGEKDDG
jgi:hypothetical protein